MAIRRRELLVGAGALLAPRPAFSNVASDLTVWGTWQSPDGAFHAGDTAGVHEFDLPDRGHDLAFSPDGRSLVVAARRPGRFLMVLDLTGASDPQIVPSPDGRHVYGHSVFSTDGALLYVTENAYESGDGRIAVMDARDGFRRVDDLPSHGIGPHDIALTPDGRHLVVANGGIRTHPEREREKLNLDIMRPALVLMDLEGHEVERAELSADLHQVSLRHIDVDATGLVAAGGQWEGDPGRPVPLVVTWRPGCAPAVNDDLAAENLGLNGYVGQIAFDRSGRYLAVTSPVGGTVACWDATTLEPVASWPLPDVCGVTATADEATFVVSLGLGAIRRLQVESGGSPALDVPAGPARAWDNHLLFQG